jgi:predicted HicB family RNase H-like nuclease
MPSVLQYSEIGDAALSSKRAEAVGRREVTPLPGIQKAMIFHCAIDRDCLVGHLPSGFLAKGQCAQALEGIGAQDYYARIAFDSSEEFKNSVEEYLAWCAEEGIKHEKTRLGKLTIRVDEALHRRLAVAAAARGESVNAWITRLLDRETRRVLKEHGLAG